MFEQMVKDMIKKKASIEKAYKEAPTGQAPLGRHVTKIIKFGVGKPTKNGDQQLVITRTILSPEGKGEVCFQRMMPGHETQGARFRLWLERCGYELKKASDLPKILDAMVEEGVYEEIEIREQKDNTDFTEVVHRRVLDGYEPEEEEEAEAEESEESEEEEETEEEAEAEEEGEEEAEEESEEEGEEEEEESEEENDEQNELATALMTLAFAYHPDIEITDESSFDEIVEKISEVTFRKSKLGKDEVELLTQVGLEDCIKDDIKKGPNLAKKATPATAKKSTPVFTKKSSKAAPAKKTLVKKKGKK